VQTKQLLRHNAEKNDDSAAALTQGLQGIAEQSLSKTQELIQPVSNFFSIQAVLQLFKNGIISKEEMQEKIQKMTT